MKSIILLFQFLFLFVFYSCKINEPTDQYSNSISENGITVFVKNGKINANGEIKIINSSANTIFVSYLKTTDCIFLLYNVEQNINNEWIGLSYDAEQNKWVNKVSLDSVFTICEESKNPIEIRNYQNFKHEINGIESKGEYRLSMYYGFTPIYNPDYRKLVISYLVQ